MTKATAKRRKKAGKQIKGDGASGKFVLGRSAFSSISAVEGITLSKGMRKDLDRTEGMSTAKRRSVLAAKYGKE